MKTTLGYKQKCDLDGTSYVGAFYRTLSSFEILLVVLETYLSTLLV